MSSAPDWENCWEQWSALAAGGSQEGWTTSVVRGCGVLEELMIVKRIRVEDYRESGGLFTVCGLLAQQLTADIPKELQASIKARNDAVHPPYIQPDRGQARRAVACFEATVRALSEESDGERPDEQRLIEIKRELRLGYGKRDLAGHREWEQYRRAHPRGDIVTGKVARRAARAAFVRLAPGVIGRVDVSEISDRPTRAAEERLRVGQDVRVLINEYVEGANTIILKIGR